MNLFKRILVGVFIFSVLLNCATEDEEPQQSGNNLNTEDVVENQRLEKVLSKATQTTAIKVFVYDKDNLPIEGVSASIGSALLTSNSDGVAFNENVVINKEYALITFKKSGFVSLTKTLAPSTNGITEVSVKMIASSTSTSLTFNSSVESKVIPFAGAEIIFPANSLFNVNTRKDYSGTVTLKANYFNPFDTDFSMKSPGAFFGLNSSESLVPMTTSFGIIEVLLTDSNGNPLNLKTGSKATLKMPAPLGSPASVALWHFNKKYSVWVQVGTANKQGNLYVGDVNYFSSYSLATTSTDTSNVNITIKHGNNLLSGQKVDLFLNGKSISNGFTDNMGKISFLKLAPNEPYKIKIAGCNEPVEKELSPIAIGENNKTFDISDHPNTKLFQIKGELKNCSNQILANKVFTFSKLYDGKKRHYTIKTNTNGEFNHFVNECSNLVVPKTKYVASFSIKDSSDEFYTADVTSLEVDGSLDLVLNSCKGINDALLDDADIIDFTDPDFKQFIITNHFNTNTEITFGMAKTLKKIILQTGISSIENVDELEYFIGLDTLEVIGSKITKLPDLSNLTKLKSLIIRQNNSFNSEIPLEIGQLPLLENLQLENNTITGNIPEFSSSMTKLKNLSIQNNSKLTSPTIPSSIGNLINLESLKLNNNKLTGIIPSTIGNLTKLKTLYLNTNLLTGGIPSSISNLTLAININLFKNKLNSTIPSSIGNMTSLQYLDFSNNELTGSIPSEIGNLTNLTSLNLSTNKFSGNIPNLENLDKLFTLTLNGNMLTGSIPGTIKNMAKLQNITLNNNQLMGDIPEFPSTLFSYILSNNTGLTGKTNEAKLCIFGTKFGTKAIVDAFISGTGIENNCPENPAP